LDFFLANKIKFLQFIPCVEVDPQTGNIADFSVTPEQYGNFLCRTFDRWYEYGPQKLSIRDFESIVSWCIYGKHTICTFNKKCSDYMVVEHSGDCFVCDFFVEPKWRLGNILNTPIEKLFNSGKKKSFARCKTKLSDKCLLCSYLDVCRGGCLKDRAPLEKDKYNGENYFCKSYKQFFEYAMPKFMHIAASISSNRTQF